MERKSVEVDSRQYYNSLKAEDVYGRRKLAWWVPYYTEKRLIVQLAYSLSLDCTPFVVDVGSGNGLLTNILVAEGLDVLGVDSDHYSSLPSLADSARFKKADIWDLLEELGPQHNIERTGLIRHALERFRNLLGSDSLLWETMGDYGFTFSEHDDGTIGRWEEELKVLQKLVAQSQSPSPVDVAICSFMSHNQELTIPIRDGVVPKCIVYVRLPVGKTGSGDYYELESKILKSTEDFRREGLYHLPKFRRLKDQALSFSPGRNYRTICCWRTPSHMDWDECKGTFSGESFRAEVLIQMRKDVVLGQVQPREVGRCAFDESLEVHLQGSEKWDNFKIAVQEARARLFRE